MITLTCCGLSVLQVLLHAFHVEQYVAVLIAQLHTSASCTNFFVRVSFEAAAAHA